jgi:hypothetical protein
MTVYAGIRLEAQKKIAKPQKIGREIKCALFGASDSKKKSYLSHKMKPSSSRVGIVC